MWILYWRASMPVDLPQDLDLEASRPMKRAVDAPKSVALPVGLACWAVAALMPGVAATPAGAAPLAGAQWIAPPANANSGAPLPLFRKEFVVPAKPRKAVLRIVGLGDYDARVNGRRVADTGINQPWSQYEKTLYDREFDVTSQVLAGANCVGVMLGHSFWHNPNPPQGRYNKDGPQRQAAEPLQCDAWPRNENASSTTMIPATCMS